MALSQSQWNAKLVKFVPGWFFEQFKYAAALFQAIAAVFSGVEQDSDDQQAATFILQSKAPILDVLGDERGITRLHSEPDALYAPRVQRITSETDLADIKRTVDSYLLFGTSQIFESPTNSLYCSRRDTFCSRDNWLLAARRNYFLIVVPPQVHAPYSFCARSYFCSRSNFAGSLDSSGAVFATIIAAVNQQKSFGVMYGLLEDD